MASDKEKATPRGHGLIRNAVLANASESSQPDTENQRALLLALIATDLAWINWAELTLHHRIRMPLVRGEITVDLANECRNTLWLEAFPPEPCPACERFRNFAKFGAELKAHERRQAVNMRRARA